MEGREATACICMHLIGGHWFSLSRMYIDMNRSSDLSFFFRLSVSRPSAGSRVIDFILTLESS